MMLLGLGSQLAERNTVDDPTYLLEKHVKKNHRMMGYTITMYKLEETR